MMLSKLSHSVLRRPTLLRVASTRTVSSIVASRFLPDTAHTTNNNLMRQKMFFSDSAAANSLSSILARELNEEMENQTVEMPENLAQLKREIEADWRIVDGVTPGSPSTALTRMYKKEVSQNGSKVMIEFHCQDTEELDAEDGIDEQQLEELSGQSVNFAVTVSRAGKSMIMDCATEESEIVVGGVRVEETDSVDATSSLLNQASDKTAYQGPVFRELAEDLQDSFVSYVQEECGVTTDVAAFISMYADYKEQVQYTNWLKAVHSLVK